MTRRKTDFISIVTVLITSLLGIIFLGLAARVFAWFFCIGFGC
jgi:hypothetical protein